MQLLAKSVERALQSNVFAKLKEQEGLTLEGRGPEDLDRYVRAEAARWKTVITTANIKAE